MKIALPEKARSRSTLLYEIAVIALLVILAAGIVTAVLFARRDAREDARLAQQVSEQIAGLESRLAEQAAALESNNAKIAEQEGALANRDEQIRQQQETIADLQRQLVIKKQQQAAQQGQSIPLAPVKGTSPYSGKMVALTFDDGPGEATVRLLDALKARGVKATFFVLGSRAAAYPDLIRRMEAEGHVVGNHSYSHKNLRPLSGAGVATEMNKCADLLQSILGHRPVVMRAPGGNYDDDVRRYAMGEGIPLIQWGVDTRDWESKNVDSILSTAFQGGRYGIRGGAIVLMHDIYPTTVDATILMIDRLLAEGYELVTVPELLQAREGGMEPGQVYR